MRLKKENKILASKKKEEKKRGRNTIKFFCRVVSYKFFRGKLVADDR